MWFKKKEPQKPPLVVPFEFLEAARVTIHTIALREEIPVGIRWWIASWLSGYNSQLSGWLEASYGPEVFTTIEKITDSVRPTEHQDDPWDRWESQFSSDDK